MDRLFLFIMGVGFAVFGTFALLNPLPLVASFGLEATGRHAAYELRGIYGGVSLGGAVLFTLGALYQSLRRPALIFLLTYAGGYVFARIIGVFFDGLPEPYFFIFIGFEVVVAAIATVLLVQDQRQR